ncbi:MAG TPA: ABC transporter permease [Candidatus Scybalocola faecavium]|nr:ABC transporter permease [Candidatus Scybalocola faecavium]
MGHFPILAVELMKIRRSKIFLILLAPVLLMWIPSVLNGNLALETASPSMSPEQNFFIQGFMGMVWFMIPATLVIITVLLTQTERQNRGLLKMLSLPVNTAKLCLTKFVLLLLLELVQIIMITGGYFISAALVSLNQGYSFMLDPLYVCGFAAEVYLTAIPMAALFWMIAVLIRTPVFAVGLGLASVVPAVLILNTRFWFAYPMCYPFYVLMVEYGKASQGIFTTSIQWLPWIPVAAVITGAALAIASIGFGFQRERG